MSFLRKTSSIRIVIRWMEWGHLKYFFSKSAQIDPEPTMDDATDFLNVGYCGYHEEQDRNSPFPSRAYIESNIWKSQKVEEVEWRDFREAAQKKGKVRGEEIGCFRSAAGK